MGVADVAEDYIEVIWYKRILLYYRRETHKTDRYHERSTIIVVERYLIPSSH